jgi:predicted O-methyltransferase YrrM
MKLHYNTNKSDLCEIGRKFDTDKSSQRDNVTNSRHCHPYTLFYNGLFGDYKEKDLEIAEIGLLEGASLLMWQEYFKKANITGFEYNRDLIERFKKNFNNERIAISYIDVTKKDVIENAFRNANKTYDIIIEDSTHQFEDQIRVIETAYKYLNAGGVLIIEDVFRKYNENDYLRRLAPILDKFQDYYFVDLDHVNRESSGWDNDKLLVLVKVGAEPLFKNKNKVTLITPSYRVGNLEKIKNSINFDYVDEWIIVYDGNKIDKLPDIFSDNNKISQYIHIGDGISGNPQRNFALTKIKNKNTYIYYLDDDNLIYEPLYRLLNIIETGKIYTFNQKNGIKGNNVKVRNIDTAMFIIHYSLCDGIQWIPDIYEADGCYITECYEKHKSSHIFVDEALCTYNSLN